MGGGPSHRKNRAKEDEEVLEVSAESLELPVEKVRINVFVTKDSLDFLRQEAARSATTVSALCSIAIQDMVDERKHRKSSGYQITHEEYENLSKIYDYLCKKKYDNLYPKSK